MVATVGFDVAAVSVVVAVGEQPRDVVVSLQLRTSEDSQCHRVDRPSPIRPAFGSSIADGFVAFAANDAMAFRPLSFVVVARMDYR